MGGKPDDIPQDVWALAIEWVEAMAMWDRMPEAKGTQYRECMFARAIVNATKAEREACARLADGHDAFVHPGTHIAAAIRKCGEA